MEGGNAELARVTAEVKRRQRQEQKERARLPKQREHVLVTATIAFTHGPPAGSTIAAATLRKYAGALGEDEDACILEHGNRFLATPVDTLAQWLDCSEDIPRTTRSEAERMVGDARLLRWVEEDNGARGVASPPQLVWEKGCALGVDKKSGHERCAASWRLRRSAAAKKWMQRVRQRGNLAPRPFAWQGYPVDGDDAREGPCWEPQKNARVDLPWVAFWGPQSGPRFGAVCLF